MPWIYILLFAIHSSMVCSPIKKGCFIDDDELEYVFKRYISDIYKVAQLDPKAIRIFFIHDTSINAAASLNNCYFINTGLILNSQDVGEVLGVLAHEVSHMASHHVERRMGAIEKSSRASIALAALSALGGIAAGRPDFAVMSVSNAFSSTTIAVNHYSQGQEGSADQGAIKYAEKLGWSLEGLHTLLSKLKGNDYLLDSYMAPYVQTHPLTTNRLQALERHLKVSKYTKKPFDAELINSFHRIKTKVEAFTLVPGLILENYPTHDTSVNGRYARAIAYFRMNEYAKALHNIDSLIQEYPKNAFFYELKGQILFSKSLLSESMICYKKAYELRPDSKILGLLLAKNYIALDKPTYYQKAIKILDSLEKYENDSEDYWALRATSYGRVGKESHAQWMIAEAAMLKGDKKRAKLFAMQAKKSLNSTKDKIILQRIEDLLSSIESE